MKPPRGTHDLFPETQFRHQYIIETARQVSQRFGCGEIATPIFESTEVFKRTLGEASDIVNKEMYTFEDRSGSQLTLRPEGTAGIARAFISHSLQRQIPLKYFYQGPMFRYERPQKGRLRQFHQIGVELIGIASSWADIEVISMAQILFKELGVDSHIHLEINSLGDISCRQSYQKELTLFLEKHRSKLSEDSLRRLETNPLRILDSKSKEDQDLIAQAPQMEEFLSSESREIYQKVCQGLDQMDIKYQKNPCLVRGLDYYTHCVFEFKANSELGSQNTVLAGGRYNELISLMGGPQTLGVGWASGVERLNLILQEAPSPPPLVSLIPIGEEAELKAIEIIHKLRGQGFHLDSIYSGNLNKRMKKADKSGACGAILIGDDELTKGIIQLKDFATGNQESIPLSQLGQAIRDLTSRSSRPTSNKLL